jgi:hypothetical protein
MKLPGDGQGSNRCLLAILEATFNRHCLCILSPCLPDFEWFRIDFLLLKGLSKFCGGSLNDAKVYGNILQIRETGYTSRAPMFEKSKL